MFLKLLESWSDKRIEKVLQKSGFDFYPLPANDSRPGRPRPANAKLWLEDWSEKDDIRMANNDYVWEGYIA